MAYAHKVVYYGRTYYGYTNSVEVSSAQILTLPLTLTLALTLALAITLPLPLPLPLTQVSSRPARRRDLSSSAGDRRCWATAAE